MYIYSLPVFMEILALLEAIANPIKNPFSVEKGTLKNRELSFSLKNISQNTGLSQKRLYGENHIEEFLEPLIKTNRFASVERIFISAWDMGEFHTMLEILLSITDADTQILIPDNYSRQQIPTEIQTIQTNLFASYNSCELFNKLIRKNAFREAT